MKKITFLIAILFLLIAPVSVQAQETPTKEVKKACCSKAAKKTCTAEEKKTCTAEGKKKDGKKCCSKEAKKA